MFGYLGNSQAPLSEWLTALAGRRRFLVFAAAGVVGALGHPPLGWPILTFFSLLFLFVAAPWRLGPRGAAWAGWAYGVGYFAVVLHWIVEPFLVDIARHGWMAPLAISLMAGGLALFYGAAFAVAGWRRSGLVLALALSAAELGRAHLFGGFPWGMHVAAFVDVLFYQAAAWLGPFGLTLAFLVFFAFVARLQPYIGGALAAALGALTLVSVPPAEEAVEEGPLIRVVQPNARQDLKWLPDQAPIFLNRKLQATAAAPAADLVIWPETALTTWMQEADPIFAEAARVGQGAELL
ncbi:MAG: apolipoprotein N-acyltransferase, partial [Pseudomonadota bacterium]